MHFFISRVFARFFLVWEHYGCTVAILYFFVQKQMRPFCLLYQLDMFELHYNIQYMLICQLKIPSITYEIISQYFRTKKGNMIFGQKFGSSGHSSWRHLGMQQRLIPKTFSLISVQMHKVIWRSSRSKKGA